MVECIGSYKGLRDIRRTFFIEGRTVLREARTPASRRLPPRSHIELRLHCSLSRDEMCNSQLSSL